MISLRSTRLPVARASLAVVACALPVLGSATRSSAATTFYTCKSVNVSSFAEQRDIMPMTSSLPWGAVGFVDNGCTGTLILQLNEFLAAKIKAYGHPLPPMKAIRRP